MELRKIDLLKDRSDQVKEIMSRKPLWMIRWGTTVNLIVLGLFGMLAWLVKYPDIIPAQVVITTPHPPRKAIARTEGTIASLRISDQQIVTQGDLLAVIDNPANTQDVFTLKSFLQHDLSDTDSISYLATSFPTQLSLGSLQSAYNQLQQALRDWAIYTQLDTKEQELSMISRQLADYERLQREQEAATETLFDTYQLAQKEYERSEKLFESRTISAQQWEEAQRNFLQIKQAWQVSQAAQLESEIRIAELEKAAMREQIRDTQSQNELYNQVLTGWEMLQSQVAQWEEDFLIYAPISGKTSFFNVWQQDQLIRNGEELCTIVPLNAQSVEGQMQISVKNAGKVSKNQQVLIQLDSYPSSEFGMLKGIVSSVSLVPRNQRYAIKVDLPEGLRTTYQRRIPFRQELSGSAEIITEDLTILDRILQYFLQVAKRYPS